MNQLREATHPKRHWIHARLKQHLSITHSLLLAVIRFCNSEKNAAAAFESPIDLFAAAAFFLQYLRLHHTLRVSRMYQTPQNFCGVDT
jgi:hypothetical protein